MPIVVLACLGLVLLSTTVHYEALRLLNFLLPRASIPARSKVLVVVLGAFVAHAIQIVMYGLALFGLVRFASAGVLNASAGFSWTSCLYFSAETFTSLGFGDITPVGPVRLLAGVEALNGLLLIGWSVAIIFEVMKMADVQVARKDSSS